MRYQPKAIAKAFSWTVGILYSICTLVVIYLPGLALGIAGAWYHSVDASLLMTSAIPLAGFITGLVSAMLTAWAAGYLVAGFANYFSKR